MIPGAFRKRGSNEVTGLGFELRKHRFEFHQPLNHYANDVLKTMRLNSPFETPIFDSCWGFSTFKFPFLRSAVSTTLKIQEKRKLRKFSVGKRNFFLHQKFIFRCWEKRQEISSKLNHNFYVLSGQNLILWRNFRVKKVEWFAIFRCVTSLGKW